MRRAGARRTPERVISESFAEGDGVTVRGGRGCRAAYAREFQDIPAGLWCG